MMNKNQLSRYCLTAFALFIPLILLCMVFSNAFAQDKSKTDTIKQVTAKHVIDHKTKFDNALIILDGKVVDKTEMKAMNPADIYSVNVLKGKVATDIYGRKGKNGVILVTSNMKSKSKHSGCHVLQGLV